MQLDEATSKLFDAIHDELMLLFGQWKIHDQLYGSGEENLALLRKSGGNVFYYLQGLLEENAFLTLARLTDPERTGGHENASFPLLVEAVAPYLDDAANRDLKRRLKALQDAVDNIREHRNKRIAHRDSATATGSHSLPQVSYGDVDDAMDLTGSLMGKVWLHLGKGSTDYDDPHLPYGSDGQKLLSVLRRGHDHGRSNHALDSDR
jgi:hypothetical protein